MCKEEAHGDLNGEQCQPIPKFEFRFCNLKFFWIQAPGFCKNWGMTAHVNVMLYPMGWGGHHIDRAQNGREFSKQTLHVFRHRVRNVLCLGWLSCWQNRKGWV
jgi:hypothetical protein